MTRIAPRRRGGNDRGAVAPLVAVLLAGGVLLGMAAWVVDLGVIYAERDQVLNAAGAAALAAAEQCVQPGSLTCGSAGALDSIANANAADNQMSIDRLCGRMLGTSRFRGCRGTTGGAATKCLAPPPTNLSYAEVHTGTRTADGKTVLPPIFSRGAGTHVSGCARVAWGPPQGPYAGLGMSRCAFLAKTGGITDQNGFEAPPPGNETPGAEVVIPLEINPDPLVDGKPDDCDDVAYYQSSGNCLVNAAWNSTINGWVDNTNHTAKYSAQPPPGCQGLLQSTEFARDATRPYLLMPIYSSYAKVGVPPDGSTTFQINGIAAFRITGHKLTDDTPNQDALLPGLGAGEYCGPGTTRTSRCIRGYFVWAHIIDGTLPATGWTTNYGVATYKTVG